MYNNTSQTLEAIGVADDIERSGRYQPLRLRLTPGRITAIIVNEHLGF